MLRRPVVIAGDRSCTDVDVCTDGRIAEIRKMARLRLRSERRLLQLDKVAHRGTLAHDIAWAEMCKGTDDRTSCNSRTRNHAEVVDRGAVADFRVDDANVRL